MDILENGNTPLFLLVTGLLILGSACACVSAEKKKGGGEIAMFAHFCEAANKAQH